MWRLIKLNDTNLRAIRLRDGMACLVLMALPAIGFAQDEDVAVVSDETVQVDQTEDEAAAAKAALESELASARRFEVELDALLLSDGQLDVAQADALNKLRSLATRCGILANSALHDEVRLLLLGYQARALAAIASLESVDQRQDAGRMQQLHDTAQQIAALALPGAAAKADYWLLVAEMGQVASSKKSPTRQRADIERSLATYIDSYRDDAQADEFLLDTRLSLAQLMDQRGAQRDAGRQLAQIGKLAEDSPRLGEVKRLRESIARLGSPITIESISTQLATWRSSDHLGKPVLIHVYADSVDPSVRMIDVINRSIVEGTLSGIAVVSLRVGEPIASTLAPPWPTLPVQLETDGVLDQLGVTALPTLVWLDAQGRLASIGTTAAVLDQFNSLQAEQRDRADEESSDEAASKTEGEASNSDDKSVETELLPTDNENDPSSP